MGLVYEDIFIRIFQAANDNFIYVNLSFFYGIGAKQAEVTHDGK